MKVILVGATDFVGREVLTQCLRNPDISHITIISRTRIAEADEHSWMRVETLILDDYNSYNELVHNLKNSGIRYDACIWCVPVRDSLIDDSDRVIPHQYCIPFALALSSLSTYSHPVRFIYLSMDGATTAPAFSTSRPSSSSSASSMQSLHTRSITSTHSQLELALSELAFHNPFFTVYTFRPGNIAASINSTQKTSKPRARRAHSLLSLLGHKSIQTPSFIPVQHLAALMIGIAGDGFGQANEGQQEQQSARKNRTSFFNDLNLDFPIQEQLPRREEGFYFDAEDCLEIGKIYWLAGGKTRWVPKRTPSPELPCGMEASSPPSRSSSRSSSIMGRRRTLRLISRATAYMSE
ncbi:hypothetical protein BJ508DRAFT_410078 [Ascobolus immersus RN42]|uniref:NAD(P)-binding domain-containing protein n=1 Tax=Ascobolus immersus RN42 TaxID=1160509 RepID=A0A3N4IQJ3_ASCIM|nr:hypothetical protein BJ508DRAFT_410078 [Ascobolus immersus RN42]